MCRSAGENVPPKTSHCPTRTPARNPSTRRMRVAFANVVPLRASRFARRCDRMRARSRLGRHDSEQPIAIPGGGMIDVKTADRELQTFIRPQTFPVAIRMLKPGEPIPERAKRPARDFKKLSMNCQVIDMARRYGWMIALTREDHICSLGIA